MANPPYGIIADLLKQGRVVPFLGAGANFGMRSGPERDWSFGRSSFLPSGAELSQYLAAKSNFPSQERADLCDLASVASYFVETSARGILKERLGEILNHDYQPSAIHAYLAEVPSPLVIITTNYDNLVERAFHDAGKPFDVVAHPTDCQDLEASVLWWRQGADDPIAIPPNKLYIDLAKTTVIYKMHGTFHRKESQWNSYVITEDDYVVFLSRMISQIGVPPIFMRHFRLRHFLFLGYGLRDWNFRVILKKLQELLPDVESRAEMDQEGGSASINRFEDVKSWAIQSKPSEYEIELWNARNVKIYDVDINEFTKNLLTQ